MDTVWKTILWSQFGAAIDMLENSILACPEELWSDRTQPVEIWYMVYHALFFLDLYLSGTLEGFAPPDPFTLDELDPAGVLPERVYTQAELHSYLQYCRQKCRLTLEELTESKVRQPCQFAWLELSFGELLLDNMRHVQEHTAQVSLILGMRTGSAPAWVSQATSTLHNK